jgi:hypothetical protein
MNTANKPKFGILGRIGSHTIARFRVSADLFEIIKSKVLSQMPAQDGVWSVTATPSKLNRFNELKTYVIFEMSARHSYIPRIMIETRRKAIADKLNEIASLECSLIFNAHMQAA